MSEVPAQREWADVFCQVSVIRSNPRRRASKLPAIGHSLEPLAASQGRAGAAGVPADTVGSEEGGRQQRARRGRSQKRLALQPPLLCDLIVGDSCIWLLKKVPSSRATLLLDVDAVGLRPDKILVGKVK